MSVWISGENTVHIQIEGGNAARNRVDAQRIECRIHFYGAIEKSGAFVQAADQLKAHILAFVFITMCSGNDANAFFARAILYYFFPDQQLLIYGQSLGNNRFYHCSTNSTFKNTSSFC